MRRIKSSKVDVEGSRGTQIICEEDLNDEDLEILEEEEANVTPKAPENNKEKKFQPQITSFFVKKK